jgi:hypothetical protein
LQTALVAALTGSEAAKSLGWRFIDAFIMTGDDIEARPWQIAENLS